MRRALFGNGIPKRALNADGVITVFDTNDFTPQEKNPLAFAVTLFVWGWQNEILGLPGNPPDVAVFCNTEGGGPITLNQRDRVAFAAYETANETSSARPIKLLDRYVVRGDQIITCVNFNPANTQCFVYGYFETVGATVPSMPFRGLMPEPLEDPFVFAPTVVSVPAATTQYKTAHLLNTSYADLLFLNANVAVPEDSAGNAWVRLPGNVKLPLPIGGAFTPLSLNTLLSEIFDGIPMIAPSASDNKVEVGFDTSGGGATNVIAAYGAFRRG